MIVISADHIKAAAKEVRRAIEQVQGPMPPVFVVEFLLKEWRRYLALVHQQNGEASDAWHQALAAMDKLLWSVSPKADAEARSALSGALSGLIATLRQGMEAVHTEPQAREAFMTALGNAHLAIMHPAERNAAVGTRPEAKVEGDDTITMDVRDPRYRELLDLLSTDNVEQIDIK